MAIQPAVVITCDGHGCTEKIALIGPNATSYRGARGYAMGEGWTAVGDIDVDYCSRCTADQEVLDAPG